MSRKNRKDTTDVMPEALEVIRTFTEGKRFLEELLRENERLRYKILHFEQEQVQNSLGNGDQLVDFKKENRLIRQQLGIIKKNFDNLKSENSDFRDRYIEIEKQNENLLNLYVSGYQLHSTLDAKNVLLAIQEILLNLVGAEVFILWLVNQNSGDLEIQITLDELGYLPSKKPTLPVAVMDCIESGLCYYHPLYKKEPPGAGEPVACVPVRIEDKTVGAVAIYKLLEQKDSLTNMDHEILDLLTSQAATAILASKLFESTGSDFKYLGSG